MSVAPDSSAGDFDAEDFDAMALQSLPLLADVEVHEELGSTNDRAKQMVASAVELPLLIVANRQTAGRGRGDHQWHTSGGALTFSLLLDPRVHGLDLSQQGLLSLATGVAVIDAVETVTGLKAGLKWPNDVLLQSKNIAYKKLAGILIEAPRTDRWIVGVGINANNRFDTAPEEVAALATSLSEVVAEEISRQELLEALVTAFSMRLDQLQSTDPKLVEAARDACVLTGNRITVTDGDRTTTGMCRGIADDGALQIKTGEGLVTCHAGSVTFDPPSRPRP